ncbi:haloacid dehalogenase-like hydrolase [Succinimonas amylolytica]|uniref:haloacid dehalogenase-like hydrolase n=1 Tax=Succinimonas amylolytica TaxID=83769 RepID=UPI0023A7E82E
MIYCIDLDGTLIPNDMSVTSFVSVIRKNPLMLFPALCWFLRDGGRRAFLKYHIAQHYSFDPAALCWNRDLLDFLRKEAEVPGNEIYIVSGSTDEIVRKITAYHGFFKGGFGSTARVNLVGKNKLAFIKDKFAGQEICYAGNSRTDLRVWCGVPRGIVVSDSQQLISEARALTGVLRVFPGSWQQTSPNSPGDAGQR